MREQKIYFPALDSLRAIAMGMVFAAHLGPVAAMVGVTGIWTAPASVGRVGMALFFVLSGFLITYLLLVEREDRHRIDVRRFYLRRILRLWPLYIIIVGICQFLIPIKGLFGLDSIYNATAPNFREASVYYLLFLPNLAYLTVWPVNPLLFYTWIIGAEEQFYLVWPLVIKLGRRHLEAICIVIMALVVWSAWAHIPKISAIIYWSKMGFFALGGLVAFLRVKRPAIVRALSRRAMQAVALLLSVATMVAGGTIAGGWGTALLFALIILHATMPRTLIGRLRFRWLRYLGRISYGVYIFHVLVIILVVRAGARASIAPWLLSALAFAGTVLAATLSWYGIERPFLRLQRRFGSLSTS